MDRSGQWWRGDSPTDLGEYLRGYSADGYPVERIVHVVCQACGGTSLGLVIDDVEGYAERACRACDERTVMLDSADAAAEADAGEAACPCGGEVFNLAIGYAFFAGEDEVRWVYVSARCLVDGTLGVYTDLKIDYSPSMHLLNRA